MTADEGPDALVRWNGDGSYTPFCEPCEWEGKERWIHADAVSAVRSHRASKRHRDAIEAAAWHREFLVVDAAGWPGGITPWPQTEENARRFVAEHGGILRTRLVTDWEDA